MCNRNIDNNKKKLGSTSLPGSCQELISTHPGPQNTPGRIWSSQCLNLQRPNPSSKEEIIPKLGYKPKGPVSIRNSLRVPCNKQMTDVNNVSILMIYFKFICELHCSILREC